jgi:Uma2 family endonuclease
VREGDPEAVPTQQHSFIQTYLVAMLFQFFSRRRLGRAGTGWRCIFGPPGRERAWVPDLRYVARERLTAEPCHRAAPDLAIAIVSTSQSAARFADTIHCYLLYGMRLVRVIDPEAREVVVFAPGREARTLAAGDVLDGEDVLPGCRVGLDELFAQLRLA